MKKVKLSINGLDCAKCGYDLENKMLKIPAIHFCSANFYSQKIIIIYEEDILSIEELKTAIKKNDYRITVIKYENMALKDEEIENLSKEKKADLKSLVFKIKRKNNSRL